MHIHKYLYKLIVYCLLRTVYYIVPTVSCLVVTGAVGDSATIVLNVVTLAMYMRMRILMCWLCFMVFIKWDIRMRHTKIFYMH